MQNGKPSRVTLNSGGASTFSLHVDLLMESLVGGEQAEGGLVPVFLHHLGLDRLVDTPGVESQVVGSLVHRSANHLLRLFLKHLVVMAVLLSIVPKTPLSHTPQRTPGTYDGELVNSELVDSQQQLNLHTLSFYS